MLCISGIIHSSVTSLHNTGIFIPKPFTKWSSDDDSRIDVGNRQRLKHKNFGVVRSIYRLVGTSIAYGPKPPTTELRVLEWYSPLRSRIIMLTDWEVMLFCLSIIATGKLNPLVVKYSIFKGTRRVIARCLQLNYACLYT